jgi:hypothetical protein
VDGSLVFERIVRKYELWIGFIWLRIGTSVAVHDWDCLVAGPKKRSALSPLSPLSAIHVYMFAHTSLSLSLSLSVFIMEVTQSIRHENPELCFNSCFLQFYRNHFIPVDTMKHVEGVKLQLQEFLPSMLGEG